MSEFTLTTAQSAHLEAVIRDCLADWPKQWEGFHWPGYTYEHTSRVRSLAGTLAVREGADPVVVDIAALLHDLSKPEGAEHARVGAKEAARLLHNLHLPADFIEAVHHAIHTHSGDNTPTHPIENRVLGDADLIDANFGLVATWRFITIRAGRGSTLADTVAGFADWLPRKDELMHLLRSDAGRAVAAERSQTMHRFCEDVVAAYADDTRQPLQRVIEHIAWDYHRASLTGQLPQLRELAADDDLARAACSRLAAETAGEV